MKNSTLLKKWMLLIVVSFLSFSYSSAAIQADTTVLVSETFATSLGTFTPQSLVGDQVWAWNASGYAKISGFVSSVNNPNDDWLISPSIDLSGASSIILNFSHAHKYGVDTINTLQLMVTDSYTTGAVDPSKWTPVLFPLSTQATWTFVNTGNLSLEAFKGKANVHFAFRYRSTSTASATWEVKNVTLKAVVKAPETIVMSETFNKVTTGTYKSPGLDASTSQTAMDALTVLPGWTGSKVYPSGSSLKMGSGSASGILTTPALNLSAQAGTFNLTFNAMTWSGDTTHLQVYLDNVLVKEISKMNADTFYVLKTYGPYTITGGTASSKIKFTTSASLNLNRRFFLDSIVVAQSASTDPVVTLGTAAFKAESGHSQLENLTLKGLNLTGNLTISLVNKKGTSFSTTATTVTQANALAGTTIPVNYAPLAAGLDTALITISGGGLASAATFTITGGAYTPIVANLAALRAAYVANPDPTVVYTVTGPIVASYINTTTTTSTSRSVYFQDATGGVLSYESKSAATSIITPLYNVGDAVSGYTGTLTEYGKLLEIVPTVAPAASTTNNALVPVEMTIPQAKSMKEKFESMVVCIKGLTKTPSNLATVWATAKANYMFGAAGDSIVLRTNYTLMDYMDGATAISSDPTNYAGLLIEYNGTVQIVPRSKTDLGYTGATTNLSQPNVSAVVYGSNGSLNVKTSQIVDIEVYNLMGQRLFRSVSTEGLNTFKLNAHQMYLVKINNQVTKIAL
ncbi:MAG TPA: choice-of-anchor J domain-containing protein [Bacteroidales bacterium]|nr:choice-of-anchor J domain-containing protein [Bacteroidales bacterium]